MLSASEFGVRIFHSKIHDREHKGIPRIPLDKRLRADPNELVPDNMSTKEQDQKWQIRFIHESVMCKLDHRWNPQIEIIHFYHLRFFQLKQYVGTKLILYKLMKYQFVPT